MKKVICFILVIILSMSIVACGSNSKPSEEVEVSQENNKAPTTSNTKSNAELPLSGVKIGFSEMETNGTWRITETEIAHELADQYGATLVFADAQADTAKQASDIADMIAQGCDYIIVVPREVNGLTAVCREAMDAGIPILLEARSIEGTRGVDYYSCCQPNAVGEGEAMANYLIEKVGEQANIVILEGTAGSASALDRQEGIDKVLAKHSNIKVLAQQDGNFTLAEGQAVMENIIQAWGKEIDAIISHNDDMALGAIQALEAADIDPSNLTIITVDGQNSALEAIIAGKLTSTLDCTPRKFVSTNFDLIMKLEAGEEVSDEYLDSLETNVGDIWDITNAQQILDEGLGF